MTRRRMPTAALAASVVLAALSACSGGHHAATSTSTPTSSAAVPSTPVSSPSTPSAGPTSKVDGLLQQVNLVSADFPTGWTATPVSAPTTAGTAQAALVKCVGGRDTTSNKTLTYYSDSFTMTTSTITSSASDYKSQADVTSDTSLLHSPRISGCLQSLATKAVKASLPAGTTFVSAALKVQPVPAGAPKNVVAIGVGKIVVRTSGHLVTLYQTSAFITGNRLEAQVDIEGVDTPVSATVQEHAIDVVAVRAAQA